MWIWQWFTFECCITPQREEVSLLTKLKKEALLESLGKKRDGLKWEKRELLQYMIFNQICWNILSTIVSTFSESVLSFQLEPYWFFTAHADTNIFRPSCWLLVICYKIQYASGEWWTKNEWDELKRMRGFKLRLNVSPTERTGFSTKTPAWRQITMEFSDFNM